MCHVIPLYFTFLFDKILIISCFISQEFTVSTLLHPSSIPPILNAGEENVSVAVPQVFLIVIHIDKQGLNIFYHILKLSCTRQVPANSNEHAEPLAKKKRRQRKGNVSMPKKRVSEKKHKIVSY